VGVGVGCRKDAFVTALAGMGLRFGFLIWQAENPNTAPTQAARRRNWRRGIFLGWVWSEAMQGVGD